MIGEDPVQHLVRIFPNDTYVLSRHHVFDERSPREAQCTPRPGTIMVVNEYLIRTRDSHEWPAFHRDRHAEVLLPAGFGCLPVEGSGDFRMQCGQVEISFSGEDTGWQVTLEGNLPNADELMTQLTRQIVAAVGEPCEWLPLD